MKKIILSFVVAMSAFSAQAYSSLEELLKETSRQQLEALRAYVAENPAAEDASEARQRLIYGLIDNEDYAAALTLLEASYEALPAEKQSLDLEETFGGVVVPIIQIYKMDGRKDDGLRFIARVREEFKDHEQFEIINEALESFADMFEAPGVGEAMEIAFTALDGREVDLAAMKGKVVLVDFWATWCMPCIRVMPEIKALYEEFHERGLEVVGISLDEEREKLEEYIAKESLPWPQYFDGLGWEGELATKFQVQSIPATFLINPEGLIAAVDAPKEKLREMIESMLTAPEAP
jgi:thiol-disulfide isomerase/thioredoxin